MRAVSEPTCRLYRQIHVAHWDITVCKGSGGGRVGKADVDADHGNLWDWEALPSTLTCPRAA